MRNRMFKAICPCCLNVFTAETFETSPWCDDCINAHLNVIRDENKPVRYTQTLEDTYCIHGVSLEVHDCSDCKYEDIEDIEREICNYEP